MQTVQSVRWSDDESAVRIVDQRMLPSRCVERDLRTIEDVVDAIATLSVRGAPAIGIAGAMGLVVVLRTHTVLAREAFLAQVRSVAGIIREVRPTAVNLPSALDRMVHRSEQTNGDAATILAALRDEASAILGEDRAMCRRIGEHGAALVADGARILTHCNAGALATGGIGTALAPLYVAAERGRRIEVFVGETRPLLQGSRLTAWELGRAGIPVTVIADNMVASLMRAGHIDACIVGADRIAANGDVANKIGTYSLAVLARHHGVPFYVAAPSTTFDPSTPDGDAIVIEHRAGDELRHVSHVLTAPESARIYNPAFDVTPGELISAIVSDEGVWRAPYEFGGDAGEKVMRSRG